MLAEAFVLKFLPVIVTVVPKAPDAGVKDVITGAEAVCAKLHV